VVTVEVGDENVVDPLRSKFISLQLKLCCFTAVHQVILPLNTDELSGMMPAVSRCSRIGS